MNTEYLEQLTVGSPEHRMDAWRVLLNQEEAEGGLTAETRNELCALVLQEPTIEVKLFALTKLVQAGCRYEPTPAQRRGKPIVGGYDDWPDSLHNRIWGHFQHKSCLLTISEPAGLRDAAALAHLARCIPDPPFSKADLVSLPLGNVDWSKFLFNAGYKAAFVLGRAGLMGREVAKQLETKNLQYRFPMSTRPKGLAHGKLHDQYHMVQETLPSGVKRSFRTSDKQGVRTDYGLIQVYPWYSGWSWMRIVHCAGCSSLGTLGAALWLARESRKLLGPNFTSPILAPKGMADDTHVEALVRVRGDAKAYPWAVSEVTLERLRVGNLEWSPTMVQWNDQGEHEVILEICSHRPQSLSVDSRRSSMDHTSKTFLVAALVVSAIHDNQNRPILRSTLDEHIRAIDPELKPSDVSKILSRLKTKVFPGFFEYGDRITLNATVKVIDDSDGTSSVPAESKAPRRPR